MIDFSIVYWILSEGHASNSFQVEAIARGLKLASIHNDPELQRERVIIYRGWRPNIGGKNEIPSYQAFDLAIAGIRREDVVDRQMEFDAKMQKLFEQVNKGETTRYCPKCKSPLTSNDPNKLIYDCSICEDVLFASETDSFPGETKGEAG